MTRADLIERVSRLGQMSRSRSRRLVETIFDCMGQSLRRGERFEVRGFGTFSARIYKGYAGRNPRTGQAIMVKPKRLPYFKVSKDLADKVNEGRAKNCRLASKTTAGDDRGEPAATESARSG